MYAGILTVAFRPFPVGVRFCLRCVTEVFIVTIPLCARVGVDLRFRALICGLSRGNLPLFFLDLLARRWDNIFLMAIVLVGAFIGFFAYRRSFRLQRSDFISIGATYAVGILLMLIGG